MEKWKQKALVQKAISFLPLRHRINFLFQKYVTKGVHLTDGYFTDRLAHACEHLRAFDRHAAGHALSSSLELGTGWYPIVPVSLFLRGAQVVHTIDVAPLCSRSNLVTALRMFGAYYSSGKLADFFDIRAERWSDLSDLLLNAHRLTLAEMLRALRINYIVGDARKIPLPERSISLITSNNTLEHIYPAALLAMLTEFRRLAASGGVMSHFIDMSDHFAHFDRSITIYNFLRYSREQWQRIDNEIQPQNRLRITDYRRIYADLSIPLTEEICRPGSLEALSAVDVDAAFRKIPASELAISHCLLVSKM